MSRTSVMSKRPRSTVMDANNNDSDTLMETERKPKELKETGYASVSETSGIFPLTRRAMVSFFAIEIVVLIALSLARVSVLPEYPRLAPVCVIIPAMVTWSLFQTLKRSSLIQYDGAVRRQCVSTRMKEIPPACAKCAQPRLPRTHHCRKCERCTPRMSHHCGLLGTCLGAHNLKPFLLLLIYSAIGTSILVVLLTPRMLRIGGSVWRGDQSLSLSLIVWCYAVYTQAATTILLFCLFAFHLRLASQNWTIVEVTIARSLWRVIFPKFRARTTVRSPYDKGSAIANLAEFFGKGLYAVLPVVNYDEAVTNVLSTSDYSPV